MGWLYYLHIKELRLHDSQYQVIAIVQACPQKEALKTVYLAELLNLSVDKPINLYQFDTKKGEQRLMSSPLIKQAIIKKIRPGTLYIDYTIRLPVAYLGDYTNTALDEEGYIFPFSPFFTPKKLPAFYLGLRKVEKEWGACLGKNEGLRLAFEVLRKMQEKALNVTEIDVSRAFADSYGQRQIVVTLEEGREFIQKGKLVSVTHSYILRFNTEDYQQNLANFLVLKDYLNAKAQSESSPISSKNKKPMMIDLRIPHLAFIKPLA